MRLSRYTPSSCVPNNQANSLHNIGPCAHTNVRILLVVHEDEHLKCSSVSAAHAVFVAVQHGSAPFPTPAVLPAALQSLCFMMPLQILRQDGPQGLYRGFLAVAVGHLRLLACVEHVQSVQHWVVRCSTASHLAVRLLDTENVLKAALLMASYASRAPSWST